MAAWQHTLLFYQSTTPLIKIEQPVLHAVFFQTGNHRWHLDDLSKFGGNCVHTSGCFPGTFFFWVHYVF